MSVIEMRNLTWQYSDSERAALEDVSIDISKGQFTAVIGVNNSGKSTLCSALSGVIPHLYPGKISGAVRINGSDISTKSVSEIALDVGMVTQVPVNQMSGIRFTVFEEAAFGLENRGIEISEITERVTEALQMTGLADSTALSPYQLSGGQQQRLALASVIALRPSILVLDEPTTFLDPLGAKTLFDVLKKLNGQGITVVIAEHRLELIAEYADRVIVLQNGRIAVDGKPRDVLTSEMILKIGLEWTRYTKTALLARRNNLWKNDRPISASFSDTIDGILVK